DLRVVDGPGQGFLAVHDTARNRDVIYRDGLTWESAGVATWPATAMPAAVQAAASPIGLVHDRVGRRTWFFHAVSVSQLLATASYDGSTWTTVATPSAPTAGVGLAIAFDEARRQVVLFGSGSGSDETWLFDGTQWQQASLLMWPQGRSAAGVAYDSQRQVVVMHGGIGQSLLNDTWEWDGATWRQTVPAGPWFQVPVKMAFDRQRGRCCVPDDSGNVFEYDGTAWTQITPIVIVPPSRTDYGWFFDDARGELAMLGGTDPSGRPLFDRWYWNGAYWLPNAALPQPGPVREHCGFIAEPGGNGALLFGGDDQYGSDYGDTWRWDGSNWSQVATGGPLGRSHAAVFRHQGSVLLFGGLRMGSFPIGPLGDQWSWNGTSWSQQQPAASPGPRWGAAAAYDVVRNESVLFGGFDTVTRGDTWVFDGQSWSTRTPALSPPARRDHLMAYDVGRGRLVLFGGIDASGTFLRDTWEWDGANWAQIVTTRSPNNFGYTAMAHDQAQGATIAVAVDSGPVAAQFSIWRFDGIDWSPVGQTFARYAMRPSMATGFGGRGTLLQHVGNLYSYSATSAQASSYGTSCGPDAPALAVANWPRLGATCRIDSNRNMASGLVAFLGAVAPAAVPVLNCQQLVAPGQAVIVTTANVDGHAHVDLVVPNSPAYVGFDLFFQGASLKPQAPHGFVMSAGLRLTIGD
ncbi:MAG: hypothetical protein KDC98_02355, partial [Planctomycetes bacterium]|nr:hypothetical protein [Planctomycetota bacterium]